MSDSGSYHYYLNGEKTAIEETWSRSAVRDGVAMVHSRRQAGGIEIDVQAQLLDGLVEACTLNWRSPGCAPLRADYQLSGGTLAVELQGGSGSAREERLECSAGDARPLVSPLMRIFAGPVIAELLSRGGRGRVAVPFIADPGDDQALLRPQVSERRAVVVDEQARLTLGGEEFSCRCCEYTGDHYGPGTRFWISSQGMLLRYRWLQRAGQDWDVQVVLDG